MTPLSFALLGLIRMQPRSGYALRKVFETTPLGGYSSSPGTIYPALKALERAALVRRGGPQDRRANGLYHLTPEGEQALDRWLAAPVQDLGEALLRFAFLPEDAAVLVAFLDSFEAAAQAQVAGFDAFLAGDGAHGMSVKHLMALEHGRRGLEASVDWARWARAQFKPKQGRGR